MKKLLISALSLISLSAHAFQCGPADRSQAVYQAKDMLADIYSHDTPEVVAIKKQYDKVMQEIMGEDDAKDINLDESNAVYQAVMNYKGNVILEELAAYTKSQPFTKDQKFFLLSGLAQGLRADNIKLIGDRYTIDGEPPLNRQLIVYNPIAPEAMIRVNSTCRPGGCDWEARFTCDTKGCR